MDSRLLVDAPEFWASLRSDLARARRRAFIQTFTFEGDRVGAALGRALRLCEARDRRLLVDGYSLLVHNDRVIVGPAWARRRFRREVFHTHAWVARLRGRGVGVRFSNPVGPAPTRLVRRNHKKLVVVDDAVYLGGINFSEHNFAWHDMMIRLESPDLADRLAQDFDASWQGRPTTMDEVIGPVRLISLNGRGNARGFDPVVAAIASATRSIDVQSAYLSPPFTRHLVEAAGRGVAVSVLTPADNNKANLGHHIVESASGHPVRVLHQSGMSHLKAMVIDGELLIAGSSNFDAMSYHILEELIVVSSEPRIVDEYRRRVWAPDCAASRAPRGSRGLRSRLGDLAVRAGARVARLLARR